MVEGLVRAERVAVNKSTCRLSEQESCQFLTDCSGRRVVELSGEICLDVIPSRRMKAGTTVLPIGEQVIPVEDRVVEDQLRQRRLLRVGVKGGAVSYVVANIAPGCSLKLESR